MVKTLLERRRFGIPYVQVVLHVFLGLILFSCKPNFQESIKKHDPKQPLVLSEFYPLEGGAREKVLLDGMNFGSDSKAVRVYFNRAKASVISANGDRIYVIVPRLPGDTCKISVAVGKDSMTYEQTFRYHKQALVSTVTGNGTKLFKAGTLAEAQIYARYLITDEEGNVFASFRDGGAFGLARITEKQNIVTPIMVNPDNKIMTPNAVTIQPKTGVLAVAADQPKELFYTFDPREGWAPRMRNIKYTTKQLSSIVDKDRFKNFMSYCPYDGHIYTRYRDGSIAKVNPETLEAEIIFKTAIGSQYGQAFNPKKPWLLYITLAGNTRPNYRQGIMTLDIRDPKGSGGLKRLNAIGGGSHRDGPVKDAVFNQPRSIDFDSDGNLFIADFGNNCIRMLSSEGVVETVAGIPGTKGYKDGGPETALFNQPWGVAVNKDGVIYISDYGNARIRKLVIE